VTPAEEGAPSGTGAAPEVPENHLQPAGAAPVQATRADRVLLGLFSAYVLLLLVAAYAQMTDNRTLLDLFDLRRLFTR